MHRQNESKSEWERRFLRFGCKPGVIETRCAAIVPFLRPELRELTVVDRANLYQEVVLAHLGKVLDQNAGADELYHVSCTGYSAPSVAQIFCSKNPAWQSTMVSHLYHMGCYAAIPAIRMARGAVHLGDSKRINILHSELCTLHFGYSNNPEDWVIQSLFGDGLIAYDAQVSSPPHFAWEVLGTHEEIVPGSLDRMRWNLGTQQFLMTLDREVPNLIGARISSFLKALFAKSAIDVPTDEWGTQDIHFAIHPGGPKILDQVADSLKLRAQQWKASRDVFAEFGNMSSATLPTIWKKMLEAKDDYGIAPNALVVSLAFGPGLTFAGAVFRLRS